MGNFIKYPVIELTEWVFEEDRVFWGEMTWQREYTIRENELDKFRSRILVDSKGNVLTLSEGWITKRTFGVFSIFLTPMLYIEFDLVETGVTMSLDELKSVILSRTEDLFEMNDIKFISQELFVKGIKEANTYMETIRLATFLDYQV